MTVNMYTKKLIINQNVSTDNKKHAQIAQLPEGGSQSELYQLNDLRSLEGGLRYIIRFNLFYISAQLEYIPKQL